MKIRNILLIGTVAALAVVSNGCVAVFAGGAAVGAGAIAYIQGELRSSEAVTLERAWTAAQAAMKDMEYAVTDKQKDAASAKLIARGAGDKKIIVSLAKESGTVTKIGIRVGTLGDKTLSYQILEKIKSHF